MHGGPELTRRHLLRSGAMLGGAVLLSACAPGPSGATATAPATAAPATVDEIVAAAEAEGGELLWYLPGQTETAQALQDGFRAAYPFTDPQVQSLSFRDLPNKLITEAITGAPTADVYMLPGPFRQLMLDNDVPAPVQIPAEADLPQDLLDPANYAHPCYILLITTLYNTNTMPGGPPPPREMSGPEWARSMAFDRVQDLGQATLWLSSWRNQFGDSEWVTWLDGLRTKRGLRHRVRRRHLRRGAARRPRLRDRLDQRHQRPGPRHADGGRLLLPAGAVRAEPVADEAGRPSRHRAAVHPLGALRGRPAGLRLDRPHPDAAVRRQPARPRQRPAGRPLPLPGTALQDFYDRTSEYVSILGAKWPG